MTSQSGFTLIELMTVVVIVAILSAIAYPSYQRYSLRAAESQAQQRMLEYATNLANWRGKSLKYNGWEGMKVTGTETPTNTALIPEGSTATNYKYEITVVDVPVVGSPSAIHLNTGLGQSWRMIAIPRPNSIFEKNGNSLYLDNQGARCRQPATITLTTADSPCGNATSEPWN